MDSEYAPHAVRDLAQRRAALDGIQDPGHQVGVLAGRTLDRFERRPHGRRIPARAQGLETPRRLALQPLVDPQDGRRGFPFFGETVHADVPWRGDIVDEGYVIEREGRLVRPNTRAGLGISINEHEVKKHPFEQELPQRVFYPDGSAGDW